MKRINIAEVEALRELAVIKRREYHEKMADYNECLEQEKNVRNAALNAGWFTEEDTHERITSEKRDYAMSEKAFEEQYLPLIQRFWKELYGRDYPLNYTPIYKEFFAPMKKAKEDYYSLAADFLELLGRKGEAVDLRKHLRAYLPQAIEQQVEKALDDFISSTEKIGKTSRRKEYLS